jgi:hypothetical protein
MSERVWTDAEVCVANVVRLALDNDGDLLLQSHRTGPNQRLRPYGLFVSKTSDLIVWGWSIDHITDFALAYQERIVIVTPSLSRRPNDRVAALALARTYVDYGPYVRDWDYLEEKNLSPRKEHHFAYDRTKFDRQGAVIPPEPEFLAPEEDPKPPKASLFAGDYE